MQNIKKQAAFTLAEVLITLAIIGVVAAFTIPSVVMNYRNRQTVTQLKSAYSTLSQAFNMAQVNGDFIYNHDLGKSDTTEGAEKLLNYFEPYLKITKKCGTSKTGCFAKKYKNMQGDNYPYPPDSWNRYARVRLANGNSLAFWSAGTCNLSTGDAKELNNICGSVRVDINGDKRPNQAGIDYFMFTITKNGVIPSGRQGYKNAWENDCAYNSTKNENGTICTAWVLYKNNMDYLKKEIKW